MIGIMITVTGNDAKKNENSQLIYHDMKTKLFVFSPFQENTYLLISEDNECILIDPGCFDEEEQERLKAYLEENKLVLKRVLNTHLHIDHAFGNSFLFHQYGIKAEANQADEFLLERVKQQALAFGLGDVDDATPLGNYLNEGDKIKLGDIELEVLHVPGHSPGSLVYYAPKNGCVFVGDVLFQGSIGRTDLPGGNYDELISNIRSKLLTLPDETTVYSGHGPRTTIRDEKRYNPFLK
jgi:glyoxylase-like metal-dependent hydrolase (beta-lactamase superfamily II)